jgi:DNA-binding Lrp family transcriptional regulator
MTLVIMVIKTKIISKKDAEIISHLRNNARKKITKIAKETDIPVTTIYDKIRVHDKKFVKKHTTLINFPEIGMHARSQIAINVSLEMRSELQTFLTNHPNVNSLYKISFGSDFLAEVVFRDSGEVESFIENLEREYKTEKIQSFNIVQDLKKEAFLTDKDHLEVINNV